MKRVLPADVYDALEFSALVYGGIGAGKWDEGAGDDTAPLCIVGHTVYANGDGWDFYTLAGNNLVAECDWLRLAEQDSDDAVRAINLRTASPPNARVSFADWCAELDVVRGES